MLEIDCPNLLQSDDKKLWLSSKRQLHFPQTLIVDLSQSVFMQCSAKLYFAAIGFKCWHAYITNPHQVRVSLSSSDVNNFVPWQTIQMEQRAGVQVFRFKEKVKAKFLKFIKLEILRNFAQEDHSFEHMQTYLNQLLLFDDTFNPASLEAHQTQDGFFTLRSMPDIDDLSNIPRDFHREKEYQSHPSNMFPAKIISARAESTS